MEDMVALERRISDTVDRLALRIEKLQESVADVRERLIRMESSSLQHTVEATEVALTELSRRLKALEAADSHQRGVVQGVGKTAEWLHKLAPWLFATALVVMSNWDKLTPP